MNIADLDPTSKQVGEKTRRNVMILAILVLTASASFGLGMLADRHLPSSRGLTIQERPLTPLPAGGEVVGVALTKKYYLPWCKGATTTPEASHTWFATPSDAQKGGYVAGGDCPGIE